MDEDLFPNTTSEDNRIVAAKLSNHEQNRLTYTGEAGET